MQVIVDELLVEYQKEGQGPVLLLLHGWNDSAKGLVELRKHLSKKYQVITPDLPGFGASQPPKTVWDLGGYANFTSHFIKKIGANNLHCVIGHSNGGSIAIKALATNKLSADKLILLASAGIRDQGKGRLTAIRLTTKVGKAITLPLPSKAKTNIRRRLYKQIGSDMLAAEHLTDSFKKVVAEDLQADATKLDLPTLLIYGEEDKQTPPNFGVIFHQLIKGSTLEILPLSGHYLFIERPKDVVKLIKDFL